MGMRCTLPSRGDLLSPTLPLSRWRNPHRDSEDGWDHVSVRRMLMWAGLGAWRAEVSEVELSAERLSARGTQLGVDPLPYRLDYELETGDDLATTRLTVAARGAGWQRRLDLVRRPDGSWTTTADSSGEVDLHLAGGDAGAVLGAVDCDLGRSPLTNVMPVRRHRLHEAQGAVDFLMAWVSVPDLGVHPSRQRYQHVRPAAGGAPAVVRYVGAHRGFESELQLDTDGFVLIYPGIGRRVEPAVAP
jgi:hypothetical protein